MFCSASFKLVDSSEPVNPHLASGAVTLATLWCRGTLHTDEREHFYVGLNRIELMYQIYIRNDSLTFKHENYLWLCSRNANIM